MAGLKIEGTSGNIADVNTHGELKTVTNLDPSLVGFTALAAEHDDGLITGERGIRALETTEDYRLRVGVDTLLFNEYFALGAATTPNTSIWTYPNGTATIVVGSGWCTLNSGNSTTTAHHAQIRTWRCFPIYGTYGVACEMLVQFPQAPVVNNAIEWGFGLAATTAVPTDGAFFRFNLTGEFRCVINYNGTENQSDPLDFSTLIGTNTTVHTIVILGEDAAEFWINDQLVARLPRPQSAPAVVSSNNLPVFARFYNSGVPSVAQQIKIGMVNVSLLDMNANKVWSHALCGAGLMAYQTQAGTAAGQTAQWANSANPTAATITNTTAALGSGLGGIFLANVGGVSLALDADYIIQSYQVPAGTSLIPGKALYVTGIKVNAVNMGAANAAVPMTFASCINFGHTSVGLNTTETAIAKAPRRMPLGVHTLPASSAVGTPVNEAVMQFQSPIVVNPGEFVATSIRFISGTLTTGSQALWFYITFDGYFE